MIRSYIDLSGGDKHRVVAAAGYFATEGQWQEFTKSWRAILRDAHVDVFHATDFYNCRGDAVWVVNTVR